MEGNREDLGIQEYSLSQTTLEQVRATSCILEPHATLTRSTCVLREVKDRPWCEAVRSVAWHGQSPSVVVRMAWKCSK